MRLYDEDLPGKGCRVSAEREIRSFIASEYQQVVVGLALACGDTELAEDAVQEALARAWVQLEDGVEIERISAWIWKVALNWTRSRQRRFKAERRALDRLDRQRPVDRALSDGDVALREAVLRLPYRQREVVILYYYQDLPIREIANVLERSPGTIKKALLRARQTLGKTLGISRELEEIQGGRL